eukprot:1684-Heterococcus_DN1.PRE.1
MESTQILRQQTRALLSELTLSTLQRSAIISVTQQQRSAHRMKLQVVLSSTVLSSVMLCMKPLAIVGFLAAAAPVLLPLLCPPAAAVAAVAVCARATASPAPLTAASVLAASAPYW